MPGHEARSGALRVQTLTAEDWRLWRELRLRALATSPEAFSTTLAEVQERDAAPDAEAYWRGGFTQRMLRVVVREGPQALGMAQMLQPASHGEPAELFAVWTAPEARGRGVGRVLLQGCLDVLDAAAPGTPLRLAVFQGNAVARQLYERAGFVVIGPQPDAPEQVTMERAATRRLYSGDRPTSPGHDAGMETTQGSAPSTPVLTGIQDTRSGGPKLGTERAVLDAWLDEYRLTVLLKIDGLTADQLAARSVPPSTLSLLGVIRHLTNVEEYWLREVLHDEDMPNRYCSEERPDGDLEDGTAASAAQDVATYREAIVLSAEAAAAWSDLDGPVRGLRRGEPLNLRWILTHLIEEYARHLGHMDLLREALDGATGY